MHISLNQNSIIIILFKYLLESALNDKPFIKIAEIGYFTICHRCYLFNFLFHDKNLLSNSALLCCHGEG